MKLISYETGVRVRKLKKILSIMAHGTVTIIKKIYKGKHIKSLLYEDWIWRTDKVTFSNSLENSILISKSCNYVNTLGI